MGPLLVISIILFFSGIIYKLYALIRHSKSISLISKYRAISSDHLGNDGIFKSLNLYDRLLLSFQNSRLKSNLLFLLLTSIFHLLVIVTPIGVHAHGILFYHYSGISVASFSDKIADTFTVTIVLFITIFLLRRLFVLSVKRITSLYGLMLPIITALPFVSGFMAYHQVGNYDLMISLHLISAQVLLVMLGWSRLGHIMFIIFSKIFIRSEFSVFKGFRQWGK
ncbi:MAG TPA: hypothetical protein PK859_13065 [Spirochaetota bacterium]|nr:hypothetical protein [Spirochaetota bacterium]HPR49772.1 hypothetical protein [Spirochaetota bacterium]